jgi:hypothetical protein
MEITNDNKQINANDQKIKNSKPAIGIITGLEF